MIIAARLSLAKLSFHRLCSAGCAGADHPDGKKGRPVVEEYAMDDAGALDMLAFGVNVSVVPGIPDVVMTVDWLIVLVGMFSVG